MKDTIKIYDTPKVPNELVSNYLYFNILITQVLGLGISSFQFNKMEFYV